MALIFGTRGDDKINDTLRADRILAGDGNDTVNGQEGDDSLFGQHGNDVLDGGAGNDRVSGGRGDDVGSYRVSENAGSSDYYDGGTGNDTLRLVLTQEEFDSAQIQADIEAFRQFLATNSDPDKANNAVFQFTAFDLTVRNWEDLEVIVEPGTGVGPDVLISNAEATEGDSLTFEVSLTAPSSEDIILDLATQGGTATDGVDYENTGLEYSTDNGTNWQAAANGTEVTIPAGDESILVRVDSIEDNETEPTETFTLGVNSVIAGTVGDTSDTGTGTIIDDDLPSLSIADVTASEGDAEGPNATISFTVSRTGNNGAETTVDYSVTPGTATTPGDYNDSLDALSGTLTFAPEETSRTITLDVTDDLVHELEESFTVTLSSPDNGVISNTTATGTIIDNDPPPDVTLSDAESVEGEPLAFTVSLSNPSDSDIVLELATTDVSATGGVDYETDTFEYSADGGTTWTPGGGSNGTEVTLPALASEILVRVDTVPDTEVEEDETFELSVANVISDPSRVGDTSDIGIGTILDDDEPPPLPAVTIGDAQAPEGQPLVFTVSLSNPSDSDIVLDLTTTDVSATGGVDYEADTFEYSSDGGTTWTPGGGANGTEVTLPAQATEILVRVDTFTDLGVEGNETFDLSIANVISDPSLVGDTSDTGTGTISNAIPPIAPTVSIANASAEEGNPLDFLVSLSTASGGDIVLDLATLDGSATGGVDFEAANFEYSTDGGTNWTPAGGTNGTEVTIPAGDESILVRVDSIEDNETEPTETFTLGVNSVIAGTVGDTSDTGTGAIIDDDPPSLSIADVTASEGDAEGPNATISFTVSRTGNNGAETTVDYSVTPGTATTPGDYNDSLDALSGTLTFAPEETSRTITLDVTDDLVHELEESFTVTLSSPDNGVISNTTATGTIIDNDPPPDVTLSDAESVEGEPLAFTVSLSNPSDSDIVLELATTDVSATGGVDYETDTFEYSADGGTTWTPGGGSNGTEVTLPALASEILVRVDTVPDTEVEEDETFELSVANVISDPSRVGDTSDIGIGTILDDDEPPPLPAVTIGDAQAPEGQPLVFTVSLSNPSDSDIVLDLTTTDVSATGGVDYEADTFEYSSDGGTTWTPGGGANGTEVTLPAQATEILVRVDTFTDLGVEGNETFDLSIANVISDPNLVGDTSDTGTGTISNAVPPINPLVSGANAPALESNPPVFADGLETVSNVATDPGPVTMDGGATGDTDFRMGNLDYSSDDQFTFAIDYRSGDGNDVALNVTAVYPLVEPLQLASVESDGGDAGGVPIADPIDGELLPLIGVAVEDANAGSLVG